MRVASKPEISVVAVTLVLVDAAGALNVANELDWKPVLKLLIVAMFRSFHSYFEGS